MTEVEQPPQNGIDIVTDDEDLNKTRPADIEQDMREMERRKRVEAIMSSRLFREELERIVDSQIREGGASGILQQLSDIVGVPASRVGSVFKSSNCVLPINDIRGVESMGYSKGEKILRCKLAATFRLLDLYGWTQGLGAQITARLMADQELFLVNPFGLLYHEVTASSLNKADMQGNIVEQGTTNFGINTSHYILHTVVHAARPDIRCAIYVGCNPVIAVSSLKIGLLPLTRDSAVLGEVAIHPYTGALNEPEEREKLIRSLGPNSKVLLLNNHGALCCGETIEEAFYAAYHIVQACETQLKLLPVGLDNLVLIPEEARKTIYDASRRPPEGFEHLKLVDSNGTNNKDQTDNKIEQRVSQQKPKWRVGGAEYEALMRMLDNAGFRTGYIYRHPLVKSDVPKPKNDVEVPPAVSSLGYLLEEEELYRQGVWKKSDLRKGGDRSRWLNSPNVYQKVEVLETGTPDPKKITKWVADGSPTHSTAVRIENALQFVPPGTNPKEFKKLQQQIKDNRRADKISAGPQSQILEGVTWDEANRIKDASVSQTGDHVVLMGAASKGIIQRGYQHNATVYKAPYAKNPFDNVTDDELNEYKRTVSKKKSVHGEYTDTDFSESEALSSTLNTSGAQQKSSLKKTIMVTQSEPEDTEAHVLRIETKQAPKPSQPEVVLSDADSDTHSNSISFRKRLSSFLRATNDFISNERSHTATNKKPPTGRANNKSFNVFENYIDTSVNSKNININYISPSRCTNNQLTTINNQNTKLISNYKNTNNINNNEICTKSVVTNWCELIYPTISSRNALKELSSVKTNFIREDGTNTSYDLISSDEFYSFPDNFDNSEQKIDLPKSTSMYSCRDSSKMIQKFRNPYYDDGNVDDENLNIFLYGDKRFSSKTTKPFYLHSQSVNDLNDDCQIINDYYKREISSEPNSPLKSPYRTVSHFGFNCPLGRVQPEHKHIPIIPSKYVPLKREMSYDEVFASPRYVEASEDIFNRALKRKAFEAIRKNNENNVRNKNIYNSPEKKRPKLSPPTFSSTTNEIELYDSNISDDDDDEDDSLLDGSESPMEIYNTFEIDVQFLNILEKQAKLHEDIGQLQNLYDTMSLTKLDPILEEVSSDIEELTSSNHFENYDDVNLLIVNNNDCSTVPSFIKKIVQMNYTEESPNINFLQEIASENSDINDILLDCNETHTVVELNNQSEQLSANEEEHYGSETRIEQTKFGEKNKIMSRAERCQRQEEFFELWEDHLNYYGSIEDSNNSDNEEFYSIINVPSSSQDLIGKSETNTNKNDNWNNNEEEEIYDSQVTISRLVNVPTNQEHLINTDKQNDPDKITNKLDTVDENSYKIIPTLDEIMSWENLKNEKETFVNDLPKSENIELEKNDKQSEICEEIENAPIIELKSYDKHGAIFEKLSSENEMIELENQDKQSETSEKIPTADKVIDLKNSHEESEEIVIHDQVPKNPHAERQIFKDTLSNNENINDKNYQVPEKTINLIPIENENIEMQSFDIERKKSSEMFISTENIILENDDIETQGPDEIETISDKDGIMNDEVMTEDEASNLKNYFIQNQISKQTLVATETIELGNIEKQEKGIYQSRTEDISDFQNCNKQKETPEFETIEENTNNDGITHCKDNENEEKYYLNSIFNRFENNITELKLEDEVFKENISKVCETMNIDNCNEEVSSSEQNLREVQTEDEIAEMYNLFIVKEPSEKIPSKDEILKIFCEINNMGSTSESAVVIDIEKSNFKIDDEINFVDNNEHSFTQAGSIVKNNTDDEPIRKISENCIMNYENVDNCNDIKSKYSEGEFFKVYGSRNKITNAILIEPDIFSSEDEIVPNLINFLNLNDNSVANNDNSKLIQTEINLSDKIPKLNDDLNETQETETLDDIQSSDSEEPSTAKISEIDNSKENDIVSPQSNNNITEYKSILDDSGDDLSEENATGYDDNSFNSIELKILKKIEENNFNKKGTIFNKIDREIRSKITPAKIEKILSDSDSPSKNTPYSSTPTLVITESASYESFYSLNLSEVKAANEMRKKSKSRLKHHKTTTLNTTQESFSLSSSSPSGSCSGADRIDDKKSVTKIKKGITRNVNRANNVHRAKFSRSPSPVIVTTEKSFNSPHSSSTNTNIVSRYSPSPTSHTVKRRQRNFITENIRNVSSSSSSRSSFIERYRKANVSAIFSKNPFGPRYSIEHKQQIQNDSPSTSSKCYSRKIRRSPRKLSPQQANDYYTNSIYPFQAKTTLKGSPKLWVSMSPPLQKKPKKLFKTPSDTSKNIINNQQQIDNNNNENLNLLVDVACSNKTLNSSTKVSNELESLNEATKTLAKIVKKYDGNVDIFSNHLSKLNDNLNDCQQMQEEIEEERQELRISMAQARREENFTYDMLTYSISEEDD